MEKYIVRVNGKEYEVEVEKVENTGGMTEHFKKHEEKAISGNKPLKAEEAPKASASIDPNANYLEAGAAGKVFKILKKSGEKVNKGDTVIILEAMKMEIPMVSSWDGTIGEICVNEGQPVEAGEKLAVIC
jgi:biotin carboxyl carrier protein